MTEHSDTSEAPYSGVTDGFCARCGEPSAARDHLLCEAALTLEPPRYCALCRRRMVVQIVPTGWTAHCSEHGDLSGGNALDPTAL
jgi:hypothetical protein